MASLPTLQGLSNPEPLQSKNIEMVGIAKEGKQKKEELRDVPPEREALVQKFLECIQESEQIFDPTFEQMRKNMFLVKNGRDEMTPETFYIANLAHRYIQSRTAALYARNPTIVAKPKRKLRYEHWDGKFDSIDAAIKRSMASVQQGMEPDPSDTAIVEDFQTGKQRESVVKRVGETMVLLFDYYKEECQPTFKKQFKKAIKRMLTNGVAYVKLDYQREMGKSSEVKSDIEDHRKRIAHIERLSTEVAEGDYQEGDAEIEQLRLALKQLQNQEEIILREGLVFDFPSSTSIIVDPSCCDLNGFVGADWVAEVKWYTPEAAKEIYKIDLVEAGASTFKKERKAADPWEEKVGGQENDDRLFVKIYDYYHKPTGLVYTVTPGYNDFVDEPSTPNVEVEGFFPIYTLLPNDIDDENSIYPPSDIELLAPMQNEFNKSRQGLSEHRRFARPKVAYVDGSLDEEDVELLKNHPAFAVLPMKGLTGGQSINDLLQSIDTPGVDPNLYVTNHITNDVELVLGVTEAQLGSTNPNVSATQSSIAQSASTTTLSSHTDEVDELLSELARDAGVIMLKEVSLETAKKIAGPGAVWPDLPTSDLFDEIFLDIKAGSSGKPNAAAELAKIERIMQFLIQLPGIRPEPVTDMIIDKLDASFELEDFYDESLPSIVARNANAQASTGDPNTDPNQQGANRPQQLPGNNGSLA
jgi:hypothetical protein